MLCAVNAGGNAQCKRVADPDPQMRGVTLDFVSGLHNCRLEFSQPLSCLYQAMQTQEKSFYRFYKITFPRKKRKTLCMALIKREILTSRKSCPRSLARVISSCFAKRCFVKYGFFSLKCQLKRRNIDSPSF